MLSSTPNTNERSFKITERTVREGFLGERYGNKSPCLQGGGWRWMLISHLKPGGKGFNGTTWRAWYYHVSYTLKNIIELAPDSYLENLKDEKLDEEVCESRRELAELEPLPEFAQAKNECSLWSMWVGPMGEREKAGVGSPKSIQECSLELEQTSTKWTWRSCQIQEA